MGNESREIVGEISCPYCRQRSLVKKNVKGKLYYSCTEHGINHMNTPSGQDWILNNMKSLHADAQEQPAPEEPPAPVEVEKPEAPPTVEEPAAVVPVVEPTPTPPPVVAAPIVAPVRRAPPKKSRPAVPAKRTWMDDL